MKRLGTIVGILMRDISRNLTQEQLAKHKEAFDLYEKVINQKRKDSNKVYSLHESHIYAIAKGKDHKKYEYGTKASLVTTMKSNIIIGVENLKFRVRCLPTTHTPKYLGDHRSGETKISCYFTLSIPIT